MARWAIATGMPLVVVTGGEPMQQRGDVRRLVGLLRDWTPETRVEVETSGAYPVVLPGWVRVNCSPKLHAVRLDVLKDVAGRERSLFKFPVADLGEAKEGLKIAQAVGMPASRTWFMPIGTTPEELAEGARPLAAFCKEFGVNLSWRLHISIWGDRRGV